MKTHDLYFIAQMIGAGSAVDAGTAGDAREDLDSVAGPKDAGLRAYLAYMPYDFVSKYPGQHKVALAHMKRLPIGTAHPACLHGYYHIVRAARGSFAFYNFQRSGGGERRALHWCFLSKKPTSTKMWTLQIH
jgi:hypothetical protein